MECGRDVLERCVVTSAVVVTASSEGLYRSRSSCRGRLSTPNPRPKTLRSLTPKT